MDVRDKIAYDERKSTMMYYLVYKNVCKEISCRYGLSRSNKTMTYRIPDTRSIRLYTVRDCVLYLLDILRSDGYEVFFELPNLLHISWEHMSRTEEHVKDKKLLAEHKKTMAWQHARVVR